MDVERVDGERLATVAQHLVDHAVDRVPVVPAALRAEAARAAAAGDHQAHVDALGGRVVARQPGDGADGLGHPDATVGVLPVWLRRQPPRQVGQQHGAAQAVVGHRRMADVGRQQDLVGAPAGQAQFAIAQAAGEVAGVDAHLQRARCGGQRVALGVGDAEAPVAVVVAGAVRDRTRQRGVHMHPRRQRGPVHRRVDRRAVAHQMQVVVGEVDQAPAGGVGDPGALHAPLVGHHPVQHRRATGHFMHRQRRDGSQGLQGGAVRRAGQAAAQRKQRFQRLLELWGHVGRGRARGGRQTGSPGWSGARPSAVCACPVPCGA